ncbi:RNA polymerase sigma factor [Streptomyces sp. NBC_01474]|uniref:RNA polymerase sigma factor n=1 Tax=Streptomyces sp. NBC_01474 TaxID=2903880 RepID=UPI002DDA75D7|nr:RNA polymerase sigma factor [Streptomyces sp. NBC_01474]WSD92823.1 RNA polymerase sigma factor [Streptomyces sp. NBC_01474]
MNDADAFDQEGPVAQPAHDAAFDRFFRQHKQDLLRYLVSRARTVYDADEVLITAALRVYKRWPYIEASANPLGLVHKIVHDCWIDHYRSQARRAGREVLADDLQPYVSDGGTVDELLKLRGYEQLDEAMSTLERTAPTQERCIRLHYLEDLPPVEIAERIGSTPAAVRTNLSKGRQNLRRLLQPTMKEGDR